MGAAAPLRTSIVMDVAAKAERPLWSALLSLPAAGMAGMAMAGRWLLSSYGLIGGLQVEAAVQVGGQLLRLCGYLRVQPCTAVRPDASCLVQVKDNANPLAATPQTVAWALLLLLLPVVPIRESEWAAAAARQFQQQQPAAGQDLHEPLLGAPAGDD